MDRAQAQTAVRTLERLFDQVAHPRHRPDAQRLQRAATHLDHFRLVLEDAAQRLIERLGVGRLHVLELRLHHEAAQRQRRLRAHACVGVVREQAGQRIDQLAALVLPESSDRVAAHVGVAVRQAKQEDGVEVQLDGILLQVDQLLHQPPPLLQLHLRPMHRQQRRFRRPQRRELR